MENVASLSLGGTKTVLSLQGGGAWDSWEMRRSKCSTTCGLPAARLLGEREAFQVCGFDLGIKNPTYYPEIWFRFRTASLATFCGVALGALPSALPQWASQLVRNRVSSIPGCEPRVCWLNPGLCKDPMCFRRVLFLIVSCRYSENLHQKGSWHIKHNLLGRTRWDCAQNVAFCSKNYRLHSH